MTRFILCIIAGLTVVLLILSLSLIGIHHCLQFGQIHHKRNFLYLQHCLHTHGCYPIIHHCFYCSNWYSNLVLALVFTNFIIFLNFISVLILLTFTAVFLLVIFTTIFILLIFFTYPILTIDFISFILVTFFILMAIVLIFVTVSSVLKVNPYFCLHQFLHFTHIHHNPRFPLLPLCLHTPHVQHCLHINLHCPSHHHHYLYCSQTHP